MTLPYVLLSCATTLDGYLDDTSETRLLISNEEDFDRVDELRAGSDAILVGAGTIRADNPRLLVRSEARRQARVARGLSPSPVKVTMTSSADLDPKAAFFAAGDTDKLVYSTNAAYAVGSVALAGVADVVALGDAVRVLDLLEDLAARGLRQLMVEGGSSVLTQFLTSGFVDELHLVVGPFFVGDSRAPRFVKDGAFPWTKEHHADLLEVRPMSDVVLLRYGMSSRASGRAV